jgi:hypothetical protein
MGMTSDIPGLEDMDETEQSLKKLVVQMTSAQRQVFFDETTRLPARPRVRTSAVSRVAARPPQPILIAANRRAVASFARDRVKEMKTATLAQACRKAFGGQVPMEILRAAFGDIPSSVIAALTRPAN